MPDQPPPPPPEKDSLIQIRLDNLLAKQVKEKAKKRGWRLSSVIRALLRAWIDEDFIHAEDVGKEDLAAKRGPNKPKPETPPPPPTKPKPKPKPKQKK